MSISNIDDLLMGVGNSQQPATPEHKEKLQDEKAPIEEMESDAPEYGDTDETPDTSDDETDDTDESDNDTDDDSDEKPDQKGESHDDEGEEDEYGNKKERMSKGMKDRLDRKEKQHQREIEQRDHELQVLRQQLANKGASSEVQKAAAEFEYDPNDDSSWQQQLTEFVKQTVNSMQTDEQQKARDVKEQTAQREFHKKFSQGMDRFDDFRDVVGSQPIDDAMTLSLRAMSDPSAFIYAASKRHPQEIERISKLPDPYARMVEMGKLEERMRRNKPSTKTPRPLGRTKEDATVKVKPKEKDTSGDDLLAKADAKRLSTVKNRHKTNR
jgi:hypothetical protein